MAANGMKKATWLLACWLMMTMSQHRDGLVDAVKVPQADFVHIVAILYSFHLFLACFFVFFAAFISKSTINNHSFRSKYFAGASLTLMRWLCSSTERKEATISLPFKDDHRFPTSPFSIATDHARSLVELVEPVLGHPFDE